MDGRTKLFFIGRCVTHGSKLTTTTTTTTTTTAIIIIIIIIKQSP